MGNNREKYIPNPACQSSLHMSMFAFVGKLMGIAIRGASVLALDLPTLVWKPLVGQPIEAKDVEEVDALAFSAIEHYASVAGNPAQFAELVEDQSFVTVSSSGEEVELAPGGKDTPLTRDSLGEYARLLKQCRLREFDAALQAMRKGLATIVPVDLLPLFTWQELEAMVCGQREIDIEYLKAHTRYRAPYHRNSRHVGWLWEILTSFSHADRQLFLRFVWGQSRLPANPVDFTQKFQITPHAADEQQQRSLSRISDQYFPVAHTCFFSVELPRYSSKEIMRERILYACHNCQAIDSDGAAENVDWDG